MLEKLSDIKLEGLPLPDALKEIEVYLNAMRRYLLDSSLVLRKEVETSEGQEGHLLYTGAELKFAFRSPFTGKVVYHHIAADADKLL